MYVHDYLIMNFNEGIVNNILDIDIGFQISKYDFVAGRVDIKKNIFILVCVCNLRFENDYFTGRWLLPKF